MRLQQVVQEFQIGDTSSYGTSASMVERLLSMLKHMLVWGLLLAASEPGLAQSLAQSSAAVGNAPLKMVVLGDSLSAGFGLAGADAFPAKLQKALKAKGIEVDMTNAGVSGDTSTGGRDRLDWSVPEGTEAVILELGANDMLRGLDPAATRSALTEIVRRLKARNIEVLLCGMRSAPNLGLDYGQVFEAVFPDLAAANGLILYPFFLEGVLGDRGLVQADGLHPTKEGVAKIVTGIMPKVEALIARVRAKAKS